MPEAIQKVVPSALNNNVNWADVEVAHDHIFACLADDMEGLNESCNLVEEASRTTKI